MSSRGAQLSIFGRLPDGREVHSIELKVEGLRARLITLGAALQALYVEPDAHSVVLGYPSLEGYLENPAHLGAVVGRFANRIGGARFSLDGETYQLDANQAGRHTLHGGHDGLTRQLWRLDEHGPDYALMSARLPDGHMGFPGALEVEARYQLSAQRLELKLSARAEALTVCNLTTHAYFNLSGSGTIADHLLCVQAEELLELDAEQLPTGRRLSLDGSPLDLRQPRLLSERGAPLSLDHHYCLQEAPGPLKSVATLSHQGLTMTLSATAPGLQIYTGAGLDGASVADARLLPYAGVALEPQLWPDAPNQPHFYPARLAPGERYESLITFGFERGVASS